MLTKQPLSLRKFQSLCADLLKSSLKNQKHIWMQRRWLLTNLGYAIQLTHSFLESYFSAASEFKQATWHDLRIKEGNIISRVSG